MSSIEIHTYINDTFQNDIPEFQKGNIFNFANMSNQIMMAN